MTGVPADQGSGFGPDVDGHGASDAIMDDKERLAFALSATDSGLWEFDEERRSLTLDVRAAVLFGLDRPGTVPLREVLDRLGGADAGLLETMLGAAGPLPPERDTELRLQHLEPDAERWLAVRVKRDRASRQVIGTVRDVTDTRQHESQVHLLMREVTHRSKNLLAIIQAMARQTVKDSLTAADFEVRFSSRLRGLSFSHELLAAQDWRGATLADLVHGHLQGVLEQHGDRVAIAGPAVFVRPEAAQNIGLALNELTSNALRFGALSGTAGRVALDWSIDSDQAGPRWLHMVWNEYGGRAVEPPARQGFGHKVMERVVARALDGTATMTFAPTGLQWSLKIPTSHVVTQR